MGDRMRSSQKGYRKVPSMSTRRILVAIDFTPITTHVVEQAVKMAKGMNARVYLIYVVQQDQIITWADRITEAIFGVSEYNHMEDLRNKFADKAAHVIESVAHDFSKDGVEVSGRVARGHVVEEIVREAKSIEAELLICAAHQHKGIEHTVLGSVAAKVAERAPCSVLIVRKPGDVVKS